MEHLSCSIVLQTLLVTKCTHTQQYKEEGGIVTVRNPSYSPSGIKRNKHTNDTKTPHYYLVEFFYSADQVGVTRGVFKEHIICNRAAHADHFTVSDHCNAVGPSEKNIFTCHFIRYSSKMQFNTAAQS